MTGRLDCRCRQCRSFIDLVITIYIRAIQIYVDYDSGAVEPGCFAGTAEEIALKAMKHAQALANININRSMVLAARH